MERMDFSKLDTTIKEEKDISYVDEERANSRINNIPEHKLDIYYKEDEKLKPILIDIHGGGFISNDKELNHLFGNYMAQNGFVVFNINYRLAYPKYNVFDQVMDINDAIRWIIINAQNYGGNTNEIYIAGHSSGGVLAVIEALLCKSEKLRERDIIYVDLGIF